MTISISKRLADFVSFFPWLFDTFDRFLDLSFFGLGFTFRAFFLTLIGVSVAIVVIKNVVTGEWHELWLSDEDALIRDYERDTKLQNAKYWAKYQNNDSYRTEREFIRNEDHEFRLNRARERDGEYRRWYRRRK